MQLSPVLAGLDQYPFTRLDDWRAEARQRGIDADRLRRRRPARGHAGLHPRGAGRRDRGALVVSARRRPARSCARRSPAGSRGATASTSIRRSRSSPRSARRRRSSRSRRSRSASGRSSPSPSRAIRSTSAARCSRARASSRVPLREETGLAARSRRVRPLGRARALLDVLPEQPDRRDRAALVLRGARRAGARARLPALLRRGVLGALVRRAAGVGAPGRGPRERRRLQHALEALVDDGLPLGLRLRAARRRGRAARLPPLDRHRPAGVRPARLGRRLVRRGARRRRARRLPAQARDAPPRPRGEGLAARGRRCDVLPLARDRRPVRAVRAAAARARHPRRAGIVLRARRRGLRQAGARARPRQTASAPRGSWQGRHGRWPTSTSWRSRCRRRQGGSEGGRRTLHGKVFCIHRSRRRDAVDAETGERLDDVLMFRSPTWT